jgi:hypothetical protein
MLVPLYALRRRILVPLYALRRRILVPLHALRRESWSRSTLCVANLELVKLSKKESREDLLPILSRLQVALLDRATNSRFETRDRVPVGLSLAAFEVTLGASRGTELLLQVG